MVEKHDVDNRGARWGISELLNDTESTPFNS